VIIDVAFRRRLVVPRARLLAAALAWVAVVGGVAAARPRGYEVAREPSWIERLDEAPPPPRDDAKSGGLELLLTDEQRYVSGRDGRRYERTVERVRSSDGLAQLSHLQLRFNPAFERLTLHYVRVLRHGSVRDALRTSAIKVVQEEPELDDKMLTGAATAIVVVDDLRVGDVVDWAYTVSGVNPILRGHLVSASRLAFDVPVRRLHGRVVVADERRVWWRAYRTPLDVHEAQNGGARIYSWERRDVAATTADDQLPAWFDPEPWLQLTDFADWNAVAGWASALFVAEPTPSRALAQQIARWRRLPDERTRVEAALTFVQKEVRYFGMELGANSHEPHPPSQVLAHRYGDCKDKAHLLVTVLRALGVAAWPALVNTASRRGLDGWLPSATAFDHVIVRLIVDGKARFVDPTDAGQRGHLDELRPPPFERALVVDPATTELSVIAQPPLLQPDKRIDERYFVGGDGWIHLEVITRRRGDEAASFRNLVENDSLDELAKKWLSYYAAFHPGIEAVGAPAIEDADGGGIAVSEHYRLPAGALAGARGRFADDIGGELSRPKITRRTMPLGQPYPLYVEQRVRVEVPGVQLRSGTQVISDDALQFLVETRGGDAPEARFSLQTRRDTIEAGDVDRYVALLDAINGNLDYELAHAPPPRQHEEAYAAGIIFGGMLGLVGAWLAVERARRALRRRRLRKRVEHAEGETAATAIAVPDRGAIDRELGRRTCGCKAAATDADERGEEIVNFGERQLTLVQLRCGGCGTRRRWYFDVQHAA
jgi:hypothetical protein